MKQEIEETKSDKDFINDKDEADDELRYVPGKCLNVIYEDDEGNVEQCNNPCNPSEQLCHGCKRFCF